MPKRKVLIVEDEFLLYEELCTFFEEKGFAIVKNEAEVAVDNYEEAVQLLKEHRPDIAVLDIGLEGEKDGIDLGIYIRQHYYIPVVYVSGKDNDENIERIRKSGHNQFVFKSGKPLDKRQLWATFKLALQDIKTEDPDKVVGRFFSVKEMQVKKENNRQHLHYKNSEHPLEIQTFVKWEEIIFIETYNATTAGKGNNNVLMHAIQPDKAYLMRASMNEIEDQLPYTFVRFDQSTIINFLKVTSRTKSGLCFFIGDLPFRISDVYKARALEKITRILGEHNFQHLPEM